MTSPALPGPGDERRGPDDAADLPVLVAFAASTGGIEALGEVLPGLPASLRAGVVVALHQAPDRPDDALRDILSRRSALPVDLARHDAPIRPGRLLVVPPGRHLIVTAPGRTTLFPVGRFPPNRPSADLLFTSMAGALGPRAVGVVLSGHGNDGATGATAIHACGGTVLATDEDTSQDFGMPGATIRRDDATDRVVPLGEVAAAVVEIVAALHDDEKSQDRDASDLRTAS